MTDVFKALSDENRMRLFHLLSQKPFCVCELEVLLEMNQSNVSRHLNKLKVAGLITALKEGLWVHYVINANFAKDSETLMTYLNKVWRQEPVYLRDQHRFERYQSQCLSCKDITDHRDRVLSAIE